MFDPNEDLRNFKDDVVHLRSEIGEVMLLVLKGKDTLDVEGLKKSLESLLGHQAEVRSTYLTKTAPATALEIDFKKVRYETIIGRGGC